MPSIDKNAIVRAWRNPSVARTLPADVRKAMPVNPAGSNAVSAARVGTAGVNPNDWFSAACHSSHCHSSHCHSSDCHTGHGCH